MAKSPIKSPLPSLPRIWPFRRSAEARDRARETARNNARTLLADGYRFATSTDTFNADDFFADRLCELGSAESLVGFVQVYKPDQRASELARELRHPSETGTRDPRSSYLIAAILNASSENVRYLCTCRFWRDEWYFSSPRVPERVGWCKHTLGLEALVAAALPIVDLVAPLRPECDAPTFRAGNSLRSVTRYDLRDLEGTQS